MKFVSFTLDFRIVGVIYRLCEVSGVRDAVLFFPFCLAAYLNFNSSCD